MTDENTTTADFERGDSYEDALASYLLAKEAGEAIDREAWLARYPAEAARLRAFFETEDQLFRVAVPLRDPEPAMPKRVGEYEILAELGRGGMGVVYKARQSKPNRLVALKMILAGSHASASELARFRAEAEAIAGLQHPNIVQIFEVGEHDGLPYLSLEYCGGGSLADKLAGTPMQPKEAAALVETLARAMHAPHEKKIVHRDLKPANVLLTEDGTPKITDFGLALNLEQTGRTATGAILGTPSYMAPEQARGRESTRRAGEGSERERLSIVPATDVYALGTILYECVTGRPPFKAATPMDTLLQVIGDEPVPPRQFQPRLPRDLETICAKCLRKEPSNRYPTAIKLAEDLRRFQRGEAILARPVGRVERAIKWVRRNPARAGLLTVILLAVVTFLLVNLHYTSRLAEEVRQAQFQALRAETARHAIQIDVALRAWEQNNMIQAEKVLGQVTFPFQRTWESRYLLHLNRRKVRSLIGHTNNVLTVAFSPDGKYIASGGLDHTVIVWNVMNGQESTTLKGHTGIVTSVVYSAYGGRIVSGSLDGTVKVWDARTGQVKHTFKGKNGPVFNVALSPDGKRVASGGTTGGGEGLTELLNPGELVVWDADTGKVVQTLTGHTATVRSVSFHPDGHHLVSGGGRIAYRTVKDLSGRIVSLEHSQAGVDDIVELKVWDLETGQASPDLKGHTGAINAVAVSPNGKWIASASADRTVRVWDTDTGRQRFVFAGHSKPVSCAAFSPDGRRIVSTVAETGSVSRIPFEVKIWDAETGQELNTLLAHAIGVYSVAFSPDGRLIASGGEDKTVKVWDPEASQAKVTLEGPPYPYCLAISPDCQRLVSSTRNLDNQVEKDAERQELLKVIKLDTGEELISFQAHSSKILCVAFSPDGKRIASGGVDRAVKVWAADTGQELLSLLGHGDHVACVAFSPDGKRIASGGVDRAVKVWAADTGQELLSLLGHSLPVTCVEFSKKGESILSGSTNYSHNGELRIWDTLTGKCKLAHPTSGNSSEVPQSNTTISPDGKRIIFSSSSQGSSVFRCKPGRTKSGS